MRGDKVAHGRCVPAAAYIYGEVAHLHCMAHRFAHRHRYRGVPQISQQHLGGLNCRQRVGNIASGVFWRRPVNGLEHSDSLGAHVCTGRHAQLSLQLRAEAAKELVGDADLEALQMTQHPHDQSIDVVMLCLNVWILGGDLVKGLLPEVVGKTCINSRLL